MLEAVSEADSQNTDSQRSKHSANTGNKSTLLTWYNYFSHADWEKLTDAHRSWYVKSEFAVHKSRSFGCVDPCEQSVKILLALLLKLHHGTEQPNALVKFRYFNDLKALFVSEAQTRKSMHVPPPMLEYPKNARDLPEAVAAAIGDDYVDRDDSADIVGLTSISHTIPMRKSSALLRGFDQDVIEDAAKSIPRSSPVRHAPDTNSKRVKVEAAQAVDSKPVANASDSQPKGSDVHKYCPECGTHLHSHIQCELSQAIKTEPADDLAGIRSRLRLNGVRLTDHAMQSNAEPTMSLKTEPGMQPKTDPAADSHLKSTLPQPSNAFQPDAQPPRLDAHAQAALDALRNRKEKREAAKAAEHAAGADHGGDDDDGDDDDEEPDCDDDKPVAKKRPAAAGVTKKPATKDARTKTKKLKKKGRPTGGRTGCPKCRGRGCSKCKNPKYKGTRITEAEYNARKRKKKSK